MQSMDLTELGWNARLDEAFAAHAADGLTPGRVALEHTHIYRVFTGTGEWLARVSGRLRHRAAARVDFPAIGDWVAVEPPTHGGDARILAVLPRTSRFSRRAAGDPTEEQIVAANIDTVFLVTSLDGDFNLRRIERYLSSPRTAAPRPPSSSTRRISSPTRNASLKKCDASRRTARYTPSRAACRIASTSSAIVWGRARPGRSWVRPEWASRRSSTS
jgi:hypothetical protein